MENQITDFKDVLLGRHSIRKYTKGIKISHEEMTQMLSEASSAPSACNLQAWHYVVIDLPEGEDKVKQFFMKFNYPQAETASAIVMVVGDTDAYKQYRDLWYQMYDEHKLSKEQLDSVINTFLPMYEKASHEFLEHDSVVDASLAAMQLMLVARNHGYDSNPIAGMDGNKALEVLGLDPTRYVPVMAIALGKADPDYENIHSIRFPIEDKIEFQ